MLMKVSRNTLVAFLLVGAKAVMAGYDYNPNTGWDVEITSDKVDFHVLPPPDIQQEKWSLLKLNEKGLEYASYSYGYDFQFTKSYYDTIPVNVVICQDSIWIQGMVNWSTKSYSRGNSKSWNFNVPDAWVKAKFSEDRIEFEPRQLSCEFQFEGVKYSLFISPAHVDYDWFWGNTAYSVTTTATSIDSIELKRMELDGTMGFACGGDRSTGQGADGLAIFEGPETIRTPGYLLGTRDSSEDTREGGRGLGIYGNIRFIKISGNGITEVTEDNMDSPVQYYDLMGRRYSTPPQTPGIYIYKGKKYVIKR